MPRKLSQIAVQWVELNVACEACHGPGSRHLTWAKAKAVGKPAVEDGAKGLRVRLDERRGIMWSVNAATGNAARSQPRANEREIEVCAQCHARRGQIAEGYQAGKPLLDYYRPALLGAPLYHADGQQRGAFERAAIEYVDTHRYNADRAEARVNLGTFYASRGDAARGEEELKAAIRLEPRFIPAYVNLADLYRAGGRDAEGERILRDGLKNAPNSAILHHGLGLALVRMKRADTALGELESATTLEPANARFTYVYAVALHSTCRSEEAIRRLEQALLAHPNDRDIVQALASFHEALGASAAAEKYADRLQR